MRRCRTETRKHLVASMHLRRMVRLAPLLFLEERQRWLLLVDEELKLGISAICKWLFIVPSIHSTS